MHTINIWRIWVAVDTELACKRQTHFEHFIVVANANKGKYNEHRRDGSQEVDMPSVLFPSGQLNACKRQSQHGFCRTRRYHAPTAMLWKIKISMRTGNDARYKCDSCVELNHTREIWFAHKPAWKAFFLASRGLKRPIKGPCYCCSIGNGLKKQRKCSIYE